MVKCPTMELVLSRNIICISSASHKLLNKMKSLKVENNTEKLIEQFQNHRILMDDEHDDR